ncbi:hypothetical protein ACH5RR_017081 [Cinchona calisaya]|uniref:Homeobox-leucine zipper protein ANTHOCYANINLESS 2-like n=1 Tax=Cinchona calisaya TaxID=153742 RepID=A0ABD2ZXU8_9GENT
MSFGGLIGGGRGGGGGDARMMADNLYSAIPHSQAQPPHMISPHPPIAQPIFNSSPLSLAVKPKMEGAGGMGMIGENFGHGAMERAKEEEYESRSGSDNIEGGSGDDQDNPRDKSSARRKKYHRHTPHQIQELEASFKENPHPDEKARLELGRRLSLESKQVKFWFQNRRTQMKTQMERHENSLLKQENDKLRIENIAMKEAMRSPVCGNCGGPAALGEISIEEHHLRIENARLREELNRICLLANKFLGRPLSSLSSSMPPGNSDLELAVGRNGFGGLSPVGTPLPIGLDFGSVVSGAFPVLPTTRSSMGMTSFDVSVDKSMYLELAMAAMDELLKLAQIDNPLWFRSFDGCGEALNLEEYTRSFPPCIGMKPSNFITEATRATGTVIINSTSLVEMLMDLDRWTEIFSCMIGRTTVDVVSCGMGGTRNGALQLMHSEFQVLSPLVPVRQVKFLRFCKQHAEGFWAVVDVSVDSIREGPNAQAFGDCRRLPSGCIVQDMPNGYSKVTWVEHMEYDDINVHQFYRPLLRSGLGFGAQRWVATLERQCECLAVIMSSTVSGGDQAVISPTGRRSLAKLAQRMTRNFCAGVCSTVHKWEIVQVGNTDNPRLMMRKSIGSPGEPPGVVLSATTSVWMPVSQQRLFDFLRNEHTRSQWDVLSHDGPMQQMLHIAKGQDLGNSISLLRSSATSPNSNQSEMLILQETCTDESGSLIVYAAVDIPAMNVVMSGGDSSCVVLLPSGFAIVPDCYPYSTGPNSSDGTLTKEAAAAGGSSNGSLLTVGFQILVNSLPEAKLTVESVDTVNALIGRTLQGIKSALQCN